MVGDTFSAHMPALLPWTPPEGTSTEKHHSTAQTTLKCLEVPRAIAAPHIFYFPSPTLPPPLPLVHLGSPVTSGSSHKILVSTLSSRCSQETQSGDV